MHALTLLRWFMIEQIPEYKQSTAEATWPLIMSCVCMGFILLNVWFIIRYRRRKIIIASSLFFNLLMALGALMAYAVVLLLNSYPPAKAICLVQPYLGHVAFALVFAPLFAKTYVLLFPL
jgi:hypothetical protein